jgi:hypothetical protein
MKNFVSTTRLKNIDYQELPAAQNYTTSPELNSSYESSFFKYIKLYFGRVKECIQNFGVNWWKMATWKTEKEMGGEY